MNFTTKALKGSSIEIQAKYSPGFEINLLLTSDHHFDSVHCNRALLKKLHDEAVARDAGIIAIGDIFDAMQGRGDRRGSKGDIRPEYLGGNYYDLVTQDAYDFYSDYAQNYVLMSYGNHETSIIKHIETDILGRMTYRMQGEKASNIILGRYAGWIVFRLEHKSGGHTKTYKLFYHHGYGGGGPVTKGVIQTNRRAVYLPDANMIVTGHIHERWVVDVARNRIKRNGQEYIDTQTHVQIPTFKEEYLDHQGWHTQRGGPPKPIGAAWLKLEVDMIHGVKPSVTWAN